MTAAGIIAEYNPFHKGHEYHIAETKQKTNCDFIIVVMSGNYTQRGLPAIFDKYERAKSALIHGADLVFELPSLFSTSSAEGFAKGAVSLLHQLNVCDFLSFGSETGNLSLLSDLANYLEHEPADYKQLLQHYLQSGDSFPKAREKALACFFSAEELSQIFSSNDILGLEYLRALRYFSSSIVPLTIPRKDNHYHDTVLNNHGYFSSATAIRHFIEEKTNGSFLPYIMEESHPLRHALPYSYFSSTEENPSFYPIFSADYSLLLHTRLLSETKKSLTDYLDLSSSLADRIRNKLHLYQDPLSFALSLKTKELTYARICRSLFHLLLNITREEYLHFSSNGYCPYAKVLGFRKESSAILHKIKKNSSLPLITKNADALKLLSPDSGSLFEKELFRTHLYEAVLSNKYHSAFRHEYTKTPLVI